MNTQQQPGLRQINRRRYAADQQTRRVRNLAAMHAVGRTARLAPLPRPVDSDVEVAS